MPGPAVVLAMYPGLERSVLLPHHLERLAAAGDVLAAEPLGSFDDARAHDLMARAEVLLTHWGAPRLDGAALDLAPRLRLVVHAGGTVKDLVTAAVFERGVRVTTSAAANARPVAEYTVAVILLANKDAFRARERFRAGEDDLLLTGTLADVGNRDRRVGIVGASRVGRLVVDLLRPYDLEVAVFDPFLDDAGASALGAVRLGLDELCATSDVVSIHAPDLPSTRGMIGAAQLAAMRDGATLVNTARGRLVDHGALEAELVAGRLNAVLDVTHPEPLPPDSPLWRLPNVYLTPHLAGAQGRELTLLTDLALDQIERFVRGEPLTEEVRAADLDRIA